MATLERGCTRSLASLSWFGSTPAFLKFSPKMIKYKLQELFTLLVIAGCLLFLFPLQHTFPEKEKEKTLAQKLKKGRRWKKPEPFELSWKMFLETFLFFFTIDVNISVVTLARRCLFIAPTPPGPLRILKIEFSSLRHLKFKHLDRCLSRLLFPPFSAVVRTSIIAHNAYRADDTCALTLSKTRWRTREQL